MTYQTIAFRSLDRVEFEAWSGAYLFDPNGKLAFAQRVAWWFLARSGAIKRHVERRHNFVEHEFSADSVMDQLFRQRAELFRCLQREGQRLIIGSADYAELMNAHEARDMHFEFEARVANGDRQVIGLTVEVVPWVKGMVVMP